MIRQMQNMTNTRIQIPPQAMPGETHRVAIVTGLHDGCEQVQQMIHRIIAEQSSACVMSGIPFTGNSSSTSAGGGSQYGQPAHANQTDQHAYSAEWAAYHAAQAAAQQQQQQQQQQRQQEQQQATPAPVAASPTGQPAADTYYEQFFRYAYYYGEAAARAYYGAWSPPVGTPNPYGINPAGIQPAPVQAAPPAALPTQPDAPPPAGDSRPAPGATEARETGRRKVSNLPAWMTNKN